MAVAIYARQSIEKDNSMSCETQIENCLPRLNPDEQKGKILQFIDRGCTGANTNREGFQKMMRKVEQGVITKIIVYRLDRISRSLVDFCKILDTLNKHNVKFVSTEEGFDTSTDYGMLVCKILMVFAEHERNSIIARVKDAYESRSNKQIYMGGRRPYGYQFENIMIDDIKTKMLSVYPEEAEHIKYIFENYAVDGVSLRRLMDNLIANGIKPIDGSWSTAKLSNIIRNPIYVKADNAVYEYYDRQNTNIISDPTAFDGIHGAQLYGKNSRKKNKHENLPVPSDMSDMKLVVMRHEGLVPSSTWLACQKHLAKNKQIGNALSNQTSWLGGKIVCKNCGRTMTCTKGAANSNGDRTKYFSCTGKSHNRHCKGVKKTIYAESLEDMVYELIAEKLADLKQHSKTISTDNTNKINILRNELSSIKKQQDKLLDMLLSDDNNSDMMALANARAKELGNKYRNIEEQIVTLEEAEKDKINVVSFAKKWQSASYNERKAVCNVLIDKIYMHEDGTAEVVWNI